MVELWLAAAGTSGPGPGAGPRSPREDQIEEFQDLAMPGPLISLTIAAEDRQP